MKSNFNHILLESRPLKNNPSNVLGTDMVILPYRIWEYISFAYFERFICDHILSSFVFIVDDIFSEWQGRKISWAALMQKRRVQQKKYISVSPNHKTEKALSDPGGTSLTWSSR